MSDQRSTWPRPDDDEVEALSPHRKVTSPRDWHNPADILPEDSQLVWGMNSSGDVIEFKYVNNGLWFLGPDFHMYAYYTPTFWQPKEEA